MNFPTWPPMTVMGVSGSGKSTVGRLLAGKLGLAFIDGDDLHPAANKEKVGCGATAQRGRPRVLARSHRRELARGASAGASAGIACLALKRSCRDLLRGLAPSTLLVHLRGAPTSSSSAWRSAATEYMPPTLLASQPATLEAIEGDEAAIEVDLTAVATGIPVGSIIPTPNGGSGGTLASVALLVGLGAMPGRMLETIGGAEVLSNALINKSGEQRAPLALSIASLHFGFPIFFDVGLVVMLPIIGAGAIGVLAIAGLKRAGAAEIIAVDMFGRPLEIAVAAGSHTVPESWGPRIDRRNRGRRGHRGQRKSPWLGLCNPRRHAGRTGGDGRVAALGRSARGDHPRVRCHRRTRGIRGRQNPAESGKVLLRFTTEDRAFGKNRRCSHHHANAPSRSSQPGGSGRRLCVFHQDLSAPDTHA